MAATEETVGAVATLATSIILAWALSPKTWILVDACLTLAIGIIELLFPSKTLSNVLTWKHDGYHLLFVQCTVVMMMMPSIVAILTSKSTDARVFKSFLLSRTISAGVRLMILTRAHSSTKGIFLDAHLYLAVSGVLGWFLVNAVQYWKFQRTAEEPVPSLSTVDYWLLADAVASFLGWAPDIFITDVPLGGFDGLKQDFLHGHLFRVYGSSNLGTFVMSVAAVRFVHVEDKCAVFKSRVVMSLVLLAALVYQHTYNGVAPGMQEFIIIGLAGLPLVLGLAGLMSAASQTAPRAGSKSE